MFCEITINHTSLNRFYGCINMLCIYICAIICWQWTVKWLLCTFLSMWKYISDLKVAYCGENVLIHWKKSVTEL